MLVGRDSVWVGGDQTWLGRGPYAQKLPFRPISHNTKFRFTDLPTHSPIELLSKRLKTVAALLKRT